VLVVTKNTIDSVYPPMILATTAAASGMSVDIYFTFWGLELLNRKTQNNTKLAAVGNPSLPMPNIVGMLPGMTAMATKMMKTKIKKYWPTIPEMMKQAKEMGVRFHACSPTMGLMEMKEQDLIPLVDDIVGASTFLDWATSPGTVTIFV
jgi:peroxiredoxin family protein